jgi:hypothetical protein
MVNLARIVNSHRNEICSIAPKPIEAGIERRILDAIQGHRPRNVAEGYGEVSIKAQAAAIAKLPRYKVPE